MKVEQASYDEEIASIESSIGQLGGQLALARQKYIEATAERLRSFFGAEARMTAAKQTDSTKRLGPDSLARMKRDIALLQDRAAELAALAIDRKDSWPDYLGSSDWSRRHDTGQVYVPAELDKEIRRAAGQLGLVLTEYGYKLSAIYTDPGQGYRDTANRWEHLDWSQDAAFQAPSRFPDSPEMGKALSECRRLAGELADARTKLGETRTAKAEAEAASLWDKA